MLKEKLLVQSVDEAEREKSKVNKLLASTEIVKKCLDYDCTEYSKKNIETCFGCGA